MASVAFIEYKGKRILYEDYSESNPAEVMKLLDEAKTIIHSQPEGSVVALVNVKNTKFDRAITNAMKEFVKSNTPYIKVSAVYGMEGLMDVIFKGIVAFTGRKNLKVFNSIDDAKDFLAEYE
jgi:hypothetical protein